MLIFYFFHIYFLWLNSDTEGQKKNKKVDDISNWSYLHFWWRKIQKSLQKTEMHLIQKLLIKMNVLFESRLLIKVTVHLFFI